MYCRFVSLVDGDALNYRASNLLEGHEYDFRVFARNAAGASTAPAQLNSPVTTRIPYGSLSTVFS